MVQVGMAARFNRVPMDSSRDIERRPTESPKEFIERLRRVKFNIGTGATSKLAADLHRTIQQLSVELYQNDFHFIKEIIQNAEDNSYAEDVCPYLELQLIYEDLAEVGASATLVVLNNELGLRTEDVIALCSAGKSTKIGKRNEGYIGCKGIGFKSVFMISETPIIISNGYRICFRDALNEEAGMGYIVPEWVESPSNDTILSAIGEDELPTTVIILPIRNTKVELVRKQLKEISPETILFLTRIRELNIVDKTKLPFSIDRLRITRSKPISGIRSDVCKFFEVTLSVDSAAGLVMDTLPYLIFQQSYPVTHPVQERKEIHEWTVTLAFPKEERAASGQVGDVFSFLPTELKTGFPFIVNGDFLLTTSRETIRFDSPWNVGILDCIPAAFELSFKIVLRMTSLLFSHRISLTEALLHWRGKDAYKFLPNSTVWNAYRINSAKEVRQVRQKLSVEPKQAANVHQLEKVRTNIFQRLEKSPLVCLCSRLYVTKSNSSQFTFAQNCTQIKSSFRDILKKAALSHHPSLHVAHRLPDGSKNRRRAFAVVDEYVQDNYASGLAALGVPEMTRNQYLSFLRDAEWLISLPEQVYVQILSFFAFELRIPEGSNDFTQLKTIPLFKIRSEEGKVEMASLLELSETELFYISSLRHAEWISAWARRLEDWHDVKIMPTETSQALNEAGNCKGLMMWINNHGSLTELTAQGYAESLIEKLMVQRTKNKKYKSFSLLVMQCLYSGTRRELLSREVIVQTLQNRGHVSIVDRGLEERSVSLKLREEGGVLLPESVSEWPNLFSFSGGNFQNVIELSEEYLRPQSHLVREIVNRSAGPDSMLQFVKESFGAVDIPHVQLPADRDLPFQHPVTIEKSKLLLQWLTVFLPKRRITKSERENDRLLMGLKTLKWVNTRCHGWQCPNSVFSPRRRHSFHSLDLPFFNRTAYFPELIYSFEFEAVLEELGVVTDLRKGCVAVAKYFAGRAAVELDQEVVNRFYEFLNEVGSEVNEVVQWVGVWIPASGSTSLPMWKSPAECIMNDEHDIFKDCNDIKIIDKLYKEDLLPFFSDVLHVSKKTSIDLYRKIWLTWSTTSGGLKEEGSLPQSFSLIKVQSIWKHLLDDWQESSEEDWESFCSSAWVPVAPLSDDIEAISIVPPDQAFIADDSALSVSFSAVADENFNFSWLPPGLSGARKECLVKLYTKMGVRRLSDFVTCKVQMAPDVWKKKVSQGKGLISEGLFRSVAAFLCKKGVHFEDRKQILAALTSVSEIVVGEPFEVRSILHIESVTSPTTLEVPKKVFAHFDKVGGKLYYLTEDHDMLKKAIPKKVFNAQLVTGLSLGILSQHQELVQDLTVLLKLIKDDSGFTMKAVEYELQVQNLPVFPEDEKLLMEIEATKEPPKRVLRSSYTA